MESDNNSLNISGGDKSRQVLKEIQCNENKTSVSKTPGTVTPTKLVHISSPAQLQVQQNTTINSSGIVIVPNEAKRNIENNETVNLKRTSLSSTTTVSNSDEDIVSVTERTSSVLPDIINNVSAHNSSDTEDTPPDPVEKNEEIDQSLLASKLNQLCLLPTTKSMGNELSQDQLEQISEVNSTQLSEDDDFVECRSFADATAEEFVEADTSLYAVADKTEENFFSIASTVNATFNKQTAEGLNQEKEMISSEKQLEEISTDKCSDPSQAELSIALSKTISNENLPFEENSIHIDPTMNITIDQIVCNETIQITSEMDDGLQLDGNLNTTNVINQEVGTTASDGFSASNSNSSEQSFKSVLPPPNAVSEGRLSMCSKYTTSSSSDIFHDSNGRMSINSLPESVPQKFLTISSSESKISNEEKLSEISNTSDHFMDVDEYELPPEDNEEANRIESKIESHTSNSVVIDQTDAQRVDETLDETKMPISPQVSDVDILSGKGEVSDSLPLESQIIEQNVSMNENLPQRTKCMIPENSVNKSNDEFKSPSSIVLNPSDFDFLLSKGEQRSQEERYNSILLRFDPLLGIPVPADNYYFSPVANKSIQQHDNNVNEVIKEVADQQVDEQATVTLSDSHISNTSDQKSTELTGSNLDTVGNLSIIPPTVVLDAELKQSNDQTIKGSNDTMNVDHLNGTIIEESNKHELISTIQEDKKEFIHMAELEKKIQNENLKTEDIEKKLKEAEAREEMLLKRITEKDKMITKFTGIIETYEKTIAELVAEKEETKLAQEQKIETLKSDRDINYQHLMSMETTFADVHLKYERTKQLASELKASEDALKAEKKMFEENYNLLQQRYEKMKHHAFQQLEIANSNLEQMTRNHQAEIAKLKALLKKEEISRLSTIEQLQQKTKENEELVKICDELINGQNN